MDDDSGRRGPALIPGDEGGQLSRRLAFIQIFRLQQFIRRGSNLAYRRISELSNLERQILARLCETPPLSITELAAHTERNVGQVSRTVKALVEAGLLHRKSRGGGPGVAISPTALGRAAYAPMVALAERTNAELVEGIPPADLVVFERCVSRMIANALARLAREQEIERLSSGAVGPGGLQLGRDGAEAGQQDES